MATQVRISRTAPLPDRVRLERFRRYPEVGPRPLFFSGGTSLREASRKLVDYTHNSIHLISPFDSGGSSARLREAFGMLAVGDLRNRLMALADTSVRGQPAIFDLFSYRFPQQGDRVELERRLEQMVRGEDAMVAAVKHPMNSIIQAHLRSFAEAMPAGFDLRGANIGNLILSGGYLQQGREIDPVVYLFSRLVEVRGHVRPTSTRDLHLAVDLADGTTLVGQHLFTGKEVPPIQSPIERLRLVEKEPPHGPVEIEINERVREMIGKADLICFPMGSFYSSVLANLLPRGVGRAVAARDVPKVYIPNPGPDPEQIGLSLSRGAERLLGLLAADCPAHTPRERLLQLVLLDEEFARHNEEEVKRIAGLGLEPVRVPLITAATHPHFEPSRLVETLLSMA